MNMTKTMLVLVGAAFLGAGTLSATEPFTLDNVQQLIPWNSKVLVAYTVNTPYEPGVEGVLTLNFATKSRLVRVILSGADAAEGSHRYFFDGSADFSNVTNETITVTACLESFPKAVRLWEGGPYWATRNVGAATPYERGYYFSWGDTNGYRQVGKSWVSVDGSKTNHFDAAHCPTSNKPLTELVDEGFVDASTTNLVAQHDAATVHFGPGWRMPTRQELDLLGTLTKDYFSTNGVSFMRLHGSGSYSDKCIILDDHAGYIDSNDAYNDYGGCQCWSATGWHINDAKCDYAYKFDKYSSGGAYHPREYGLVVRPVRDTPIE